MTTHRMHLLWFAGGVALCAALIGLSGGRLLAGQSRHSDRDWTVPGTRAATVGDVQYSADPVIPCRTVGFRTKLASLDGWGKLSVYPVVKAPTGKIYRGFVRNYAAGGLGSRWIDWTFPTQFRSQSAHNTTENAADYGDALTDGDETELAKILPSGTYQVKWVVNQRLIDTGDSFHYQYRVLERTTP